MKNRRECQIYSKSDLLTAFETANSKIIKKFKESTANICNEGIKYLEQITHQYLQPRQDNPVIIFPTFQPPPQHFTFQAPLSLQKKEIIEQRNGGRIGQAREMTFNEKQAADLEQNNCTFANQSEKKAYIQQSNQKKRDSSTEKLKKSFKKLGLDERFCLESEEDSDSENKDNQNEGIVEKIDEGMTLAELVMESSRKLAEKVAQHQHNILESSSDSSYPITDYSSNDSSNNNDYDADFKQDPPSKSISSQSQSYEPMKILHSPKKSKSQKKRMYIRNKKIPRWAEDIAEVNELVQRQKGKEQLNPNKIYGFCVVEKLDTNIIFSSSERYFRGSSAKWVRNPYDQFIT